jgi:hypothetical protein
LGDLTHKTHKTLRCGAQHACLLYLRRRRLSSPTARKVQARRAFSDHVATLNNSNVTEEHFPLGARYHIVEGLQSLSQGARLLPAVVRRVSRLDRDEGPLALCAHLVAGDEFCLDDGAVAAEPDKRGDQRHGAV